MDLCPVCNLEVVAHTLNDDGAISQYIHTGGNSCSAERGLTQRASDGVLLLARDGEFQMWFGNGVSFCFRPPHR